MNKQPKSPKEIFEVYCPNCDSFHKIQLGNSFHEDALASQKKKILEIIKNYKNPYPKDLFLWDNKEKLDFNRGRFNEFIFRLVENIREDLKQQIEEELK